MAQRVLEGETAIVVGDEIEYPEITSCLTITCFDRKNKRLVGGHAVTNPKPGQWSFEKIVDFIKTAVPLAQRNHLLLLGDCSNQFWKLKGGWESIAKSFGVPLEEDRFTCGDKGFYRSGGQDLSVSIVVLPSGSWQMWKTGGPRQGSPVASGEFPVK